MVKITSSKVDVQTGIFNGIFNVTRQSLNPHRLTRTSILCVSQTAKHKTDINLGLLLVKYSCLTRNTSNIVSTNLYLPCKKNGGERKVEICVNGDETSCPLILSSTPSVDIVEDAVDEDTRRLRQE